MKPKSPNPPDGADRRDAPRFEGDSQVRAQIHLELESTVLYLSPGGMMAGMGFAPELGSTHRFTLAFADRTLELAGIVRDVKALGSDDDQPVYAVGVEFDGISPADSAFLESFLAPRLSR